LANHPNTVAIIAARLDSIRLPGKALLAVNGRRLVDYVMARARQIRGVSTCVVATTNRPVDDPLVSHLQRQAIPCFRGATDDVAKRMLDCALACRAEYFIRLNGDCAFLDYELIGEGVSRCHNREPDLVSNLPERTFPYGIAVEVIRTAAFARLYPQMVAAEDREHVTKYLYAHPAQVRLVTLTSPHPELASARLVVDTPADFETFQALVKVLGAEVDTARYDRVAAAYLQLTRSSP
jgi:spore coat polysaccharide biosynthesis protein SpsF